MTKKEMWSSIEKLSELKSNYSCFDEEEEPFYHALTLGIKGIKALEREDILDKIFCIVHPLSIMSTPELEHKAIMQIVEMLEPLCLPENEDGECDCGYAQRYWSKSCPDCRARMVEPQESEEKK